MVSEESITIVSSEIIEISYFLHHAICHVINCEVTLSNGHKCAKH